MVATMVAAAWFREEGTVLEVRKNIHRLNYRESSRYSPRNSSGYGRSSTNHWAPYRMQHPKACLHFHQELYYSSPPTLQDDIKCERNERDCIGRGSCTFASASLPCSIEGPLSNLPPDRTRKVCENHRDRAVSQGGM